MPRTIFIPDPRRVGAAQRTAAAAAYDRAVDLLVKYAAVEGEGGHLSTTETRKLLHWLMRPSGAPRGCAAYDTDNRPSWVPDHLFKSPTAKFGSGRYKMSKGTAEDNLRELVAVFYQTYPTVYAQVKGAVEGLQRQMPARYRIWLGRDVYPRQETTPPPATQAPRPRIVRPRPPSLRSHADDAYRACRGAIPNRHKGGPAAARRPAAMAAEQGRLAAQQQRRQELQRRRAAARLQQRRAAARAAAQAAARAQPQDSSSSDLSRSDDEQKERDRSLRGVRGRSQSLSRKPLVRSSSGGPTRDQRDGGRDRSRSPLRSSTSTPYVSARSSLSSSSVRSSTSARSSTSVQSPAFLSARSSLRPLTSTPALARAPLRQTAAPPVPTLDWSSVAVDSSGRGQPGQSPATNALPGAGRGGQQSGGGASATSQAPGGQSGSPKPGCSHSAD